MKNRKGITPIIAIVLLLMMTVAAAGLAWQFIQNTMQDAQKQVDKLDVSTAPPNVIACAGTTGGNTMYLLVQVPGPNITFNPNGVVVYTNGEKDVMASAQVSAYLSVPASDGSVSNVNPGVTGTTQLPNCMDPDLNIGNNALCWIQLNLGQSGVDTTFPNPGESYTVELTFPQMNNLKLSYTCSPTKSGGVVA